MQFFICINTKGELDEKIKNSESLILFSMISYFADQEQSDKSLAKMMEAAEMPTMGFINEVSNQLRNAMKLHLFNYDMIRDNRVENRYLIIDINYFSSYAKVSKYETMLTPCFLDLAQQKRNRDAGNLENKIHEADSNGQNKTHETDSNGHYLTKYQFEASLKILNFSSRAEVSQLQHKKFSSRAELQLYLEAIVIGTLSIQVRVNLKLSQQLETGCYNGIRGNP
ncbi:inositol-tetrakisphosphate 1-kinase 5-like [Nicotiana sylvestris]|uniref:inositol-tetrakisphosphate 1-kinase 5-like n=1 Tax=Nicotiana sylvestris TaxID=4096 RepID=UPI00388C3CD9